MTSPSCCLLLSALIAGKAVDAVLVGDEKPKHQGVPQLTQSLWEGSTRSLCTVLCSAHEESWLEDNVPGTQTPEVSPQAKGPGGIPACWPSL